MEKGYTLVVCEKPDAARRVADALSGGNTSLTKAGGVSTFSFARGGQSFVVCSAQGHLYGVSDPAEERTVYPVFDVEWYPLDRVEEDSVGVGKRLSVVRNLAAGAAKFVNACDFDAEGETIGFNILRYACGRKEADALRAKFSTLTQEDLKKAFDNLEPWPSQGLARSGRARHIIDFVWGINLSRALSQSPLGMGHRYRTVSVGRVQGPTLGFLVEREREIREFVPVPYWRISGTFEKDGKRLVAGYAEEKVRQKSRAEKVRGECLGLQAEVEEVKRSLTSVSPPVPFNIGDLQKEAYRALGFSPSTTMRVAERLYLTALISYPRTGSQKLPPSIDLGRILEGISRVPAYAAMASEVLKSGTRPVQGSMSDPAHPAIHPTGEKPRRPINSAESSLLDLIIRRFLAAFGPPARKETVSVSLAVGSNRFRAGGSKTVFPGWMRYYGRYSPRRGGEPQSVSEGDKLGVVDVSIEEKFEQRPPRYNPGNLLEKMEEEGIGTKATRADTIGTLLERGYASGEGMEVTDLGFAVAEIMERYAPSIAGTGLTRDIEERLEAVEGGREGEVSILRETIRSVTEHIEEFGANEDGIGKEIGAALAKSAAKALVLGKCPVCKTGELRVIHSRATKKRFVGCSNFSAGCRTSGPLPQKGTIRTTARVCGHCSWPVIYIVGGRRPWKLCVNGSCPGRKGR